METKTILAVDDTPSNLDILVEYLEEYEVFDVTDGYDVFKIVKKEKIDLILLDIMMPEIDGLEICKRLKGDPKTKDIPIIFITSKTDEDFIEKAYDIGGSDYVKKPFRKKELLSRIKRELQIQNQIKDLEEAHKKLKLLASTDDMTKLYNRRYFHQVSTHTLDLAKREENELAIIMLDIDNFKNINDTYGHKVGDDVIIKLASILKTTQRKSDISCRYGGEEFVVLLPKTNIDEAKIVAENLRKKIENISLFIDDERKIASTASFGVSQVDVKHESNIDAALKRADDALYKAKQNGKNRVVGLTDK